MAILSASFVNDFSQIRPDDGSYSPIPAGDYTVVIDGAELKDTKDGSGQYVKVAFSIIGPAYQGRKIWQNYNIFNRNADAEQIGRAQLKSLTVALGLDNLRDTDELIGHRALVHVSIQADKTGKYGDQNRLSKYRPADSAPPASASFPGFAGPHATTGGYQPQAPSSAPMPESGSFADAFGDFAQPAPSIPATSGGFDFR